MKEERIWQLISLKFSGEATAEDLSELHTLLSEYPELAYKADLLGRMWNSNCAYSTTDKEIIFSRHLQRLSNHYASPTLKYEQEPENSGKPIIKWLNRGYITIGSVAALIVIVLGYYYFYFPVQHEHVLSKNVVSTKPGSKSKINLPDGTMVFLNADSKITYDESFGNNNKREISLVGEAFFDVIRDENRPFIIHAKSIDVKVLGTSFNVKSYPDDRADETSLIRGKVEVTLRSNPDKKIILRPNEKLVVQQSDMLSNGEKSHVSDEDEAPILTLSKLHYSKSDSSSLETSWIKNKLAFDKENLDNVARKIERWYGVTVYITSEQLKRGEYSAVFEDESLEEVMNALKLTGNFKYTINRKEVRISQ